MDGGTVYQSRHSVLRGEGLELHTALPMHDFFEKALQQLDAGAFARARHAEEAVSHRLGQEVLCFDFRADLSLLEVKVLLFLRVQKLRSFRLLAVATYSTVSAHETFEAQGETQQKKALHSR